MEEAVNTAKQALEASAGEESIEDDLGDGGSSKGSSIYAEGYDA